MGKSGKRGRLRSAVHHYTGGVGVGEATRELRRELSGAYQILTREHADEPEPKGIFRRLWRRTKLFFVGLTSKLTPARRILFAVCVIFALAGRQGVASDAGSGSSLVFWSVAGLILLLALELADRVAVRDELEVARQLQRELLPGAAPELPGWEFAFSYRSANTIGGDYYDFLELPDRRVALVSADASGHGIAAGLLMAIANATLKLAADLDPAPAKVASLVNRALCGTGGPRSFLTLFYALLDPATGRLDYTCAGHPYPLLRRAAGEILELGQECFPLGLRPGTEPAAAAVTLEPGDRLLLYSDGIPEAVNGEGEAFGFARLRRALAPGGSAQEIHDRLLAEVDRFEGDVRPDDDRSLVVVARL